MGCEKLVNGFLKKFVDFFNFGALVMAIGLVVTISYYNYIAFIEFRSKTKMKNRFKKIMDSSEEGIIIIKDNIIDYMNDKFIEQQYNLIDLAI
jgi:hypothetical protein